MASDVAEAGPCECDRVLAGVVAVLDSTLRGLGLGGASFTFADDACIVEVVVGADFNDPGGACFRSGVAEVVVGAGFNDPRGACFGSGVDSAGLDANPVPVDIVASDPVPVVIVASGLGGFDAGFIASGLGGFGAMGMALGFLSSSC